MESLLRITLLFFAFTTFVASASGRRDIVGGTLRLPSEAISRFFHEPENEGTKWAVLLAGSNGYWNYRHQADICHAYQLLRSGGVKEENIIVFMYDDIAYSEENPRPGVIINKPDGGDVYKGVPKDYTGKDVNVNNFFAALLGNKSALTGGSGKVVDSGPNDHIFVFYSDHGGPGILGMPVGPYLYANDLNEVLKKKHASGGYKSLVFYLEACESGSIFEGLLPEDINIYATTASNAVESSWGTYCPGEDPSPPPEYSTCLGDLYSISWMEDSDTHNLRTETLHQQYKLVKDRTLNGNAYYGSHVMQYGDVGISENLLFQYLGTNPANDNYTFVDENSLRTPSKAVNQRDADLIHFWEKFRKAPEGSSSKITAQKQVVEVMSHRMHIDNSVKLIGNLLFGTEKGPELLSAVRPAGKPLVDDWDCLKNMVRTFETHCGSLSQYGMKHMRTFANICNAGIHKDQMDEATAQACARFKYNLDLDIYSSLLNKVFKYRTGRKSITQLSSDAAILMRGHPDLIDQFNKWIPRTRQDSCTLLSHHLAATHLENRDLQDEGDDEVSTDTDTDIDTDSDAEDWDWLKRSTKLGGCTGPYKVWKIWKKIKDRFKCDMEICESLKDKVDKYKDGRNSDSDTIRSNQTPLKPQRQKSKTLITRPAPILLLPLLSEMASAASPRIPTETVKNAVEALLKWRDSNSESHKPKLFDADEEFVYLVVTLKTIPHKSRVNPYKVPLPHSLLSPFNETCLIIDDRSKSKLTKQEAQKKIKADNVAVSKVLRLSKLASDYRPFEAKRKLCDSYDLFFR
ncbi:hypothetical protein Ahy_B06g085854 isoform A [Arachis hypogaea]|uniref:Legumain prodomain domain-containing protein n=1 Tax=Arachis hypogaea TaxID=3818 RepID=A0A444YVU6_ARAHY|nr:hypothetical protein Ahy_B06g085854 isoform A [Arachis hypogaea]